MDGTTPIDKFVTPVKDASLVSVTGPVEPSRTAGLSQSETFGGTPLIAATPI